MAGSRYSPNEKLFVFQLHTMVTAAFIITSSTIPDLKCDNNLRRRLQLFIVFVNGPPIHTSL